MADEITIEYSGDKCLSLNLVDQLISGFKICDQYISNYSNYICQCDILFNLAYELKGTVFLYYHLTNYYQNHRQFIKSRDHSQLMGYDVIPSYVCEPFRSLGENGPYYAPCGVNANSIFNDTFSITYKSSDGDINVPLISKDISWDTDRNILFRNPSDWSNTVKPIAWSKDAKSLEDGYKNEHLIVWMREAAFPSFRKLYARVKHEDLSIFNNGLPAGDYVLHVNYAYFVAAFGSHKSVILSTTSWLGGRNSFLGWSFIVVGFISAITAASFRYIRNHMLDKTNIVILEKCCEFCLNTEDTDLTF